MNLNPTKATEIFLILHEAAYRPAGMEYDYMVGKLIPHLEGKTYGRILTPAGATRARRIGKNLNDVGLARIVTGEFITCRESARLIAEAAGIPLNPVEVVTDGRISESDLSYLSKARFKALGKAEAAGDPNAALRDWMNHQPDDFARLVEGHIELWNELMNRGTGKKFALVLHVEGFLLLSALALGCSPRGMVSMHIPRAHPVHIRLWPDRPPVVSFGDEVYWRTGNSSIYGQYS